MSIDILYPVNMHVIGISLRKIDIYIEITCKTVYRVSFSEKIKFINKNGKFNSENLKTNSKSKLLSVKLNL